MPVSNQPLTIHVPPSVLPEQNLSTAKWGMLAFLLSEVAFFCTLIVTYITFIGKDKIGPTPREALSLPLVFVTTGLLLSSSVVIHWATNAFAHNKLGKFCCWWSLTILLGMLFLAGTGYEWYELIVHKHLTISGNMFGTTFYTLVGFHGLHVSVGIVAMLIVLGLSLRNLLDTQAYEAIEMVAWYWHFVDVVWIFVFIVVYLVGR